TLVPLKSAIVFASGWAQVAHCRGSGSQSSIRRALSAYQSSGSYRFDRMKAQLTSATLPEEGWVPFEQIPQTKESNMRVRLGLQAGDQPWPRPGPRGLGGNRVTTP